MPTLSSAEQLLALAGPCTLLVSPTNYDRLKASGKFGVRADIAGNPLQWQGTVGTVFVRPTAAANPQPAQFEWRTDELRPAVGTLGGQEAILVAQGLDYLPANATRWETFDATQWRTGDFVEIPTTGRRYVITVLEREVPADPEDPVVLTEGRFEWGDPVEGYGVTVQPTQEDRENHPIIRLNTLAGRFWENENDATQNVRLNITATDFG